MVGIGRGRLTLWQVVVPVEKVRNKPIDVMRSFSRHHAVVAGHSSCVPIRLFPLFHSRHRLTTLQEELLLVFVTVLAQSFFALVRCHLVAFAFLSVRHVSKCLL